MHISAIVAISGCSFYPSYDDAVKVSYLKGLDTFSEIAGKSEIGGLKSPTSYAAESAIWAKSIGSISQSITFAESHTFTGRSQQFHVEIVEAMSDCRDEIKNLAARHRESGLRDPGIVKNVQALCSIAATEF